ncbi:hypothetical protein PHMEG_00019979 [Phytophthora megakarya]|uniref:Uncharacterized protein n=1 Tax=Phytophthora megakarya TaxID=4795 RepID=A0A225VQ46_9STRA|nr:hypothetical protein PHMEG_00019979 [Phytophthora megakarya]
MDGRLAKMLRFYATLHWGPNVRGRTNFKRRLDAARYFEDVLLCSEPVPADTLTEVERELAAAQASLKSAEASRTLMENKLFSEQCARANAETWAQQFSADRDAAYKEIELVKSREASLNAQINEMNGMIKSHLEMYDRLENRMQMVFRSNKILTKEVNHGLFEYLVGFQAFKKSHENLHKHQSHTDPKETTLTSKLRKRNRDLVRRVKRLEKANSSFSSRLRLEDMDPEPLVLMVEGFELDQIDWFGDVRDHDTLADDIARTKVRFAEIRAEKQRKAEEAAAAGPSQSSTVPAAHSPPASTPPAPPVSGGKKGKGKTKRRRTGSDDEDVDFAGGDSGEDAPEKGRECSATPPSATTSQPQPKKPKASPFASPPTPAEKSQPSSSKPSVPAPAHHKAGSAPKNVDVTVSDAESMSSPRLTPKRKAAMSSEIRSPFHLAGLSCSDIQSLTSKSSPGQSVKSSSKSKKSRSKKTVAKAKSGRSSSDESVISVSSDELSKLRPESQCLEDSLDDITDASASASSSAATSHAVEASTKPKSKANPASAAKVDSKSSPKQKKKASPKSTGKKKSSAKAKKVTATKEKSKSSPKTSRSSNKTKSQDVTDESSLDANLPDWVSKYPELVKLAQRASDLLTPYVAPEFYTVSSQKY